MLCVSVVDCVGKEDKYSTGVSCLPAMIADVKDVKTAHGLMSTQAAPPPAAKRPKYDGL